MLEYKWSLRKSERLKKTRGVSFDEITKAKVVANREHPKRAHQNILLFEHKGYIWVVPYVAISDQEVFLKTLYPSRRYTKLYKRGEL